MNEEKWISSFLDLNTRGQLKVSESIATWLKLHETSEKDYDVEKSKRIREFFETILPTINNINDMKKIETLLERFEKLSPERQKILINSLSEDVDYYLDKQAQEEKEDICKREGHDFPNTWIYRKWTQIVDGQMDHHDVKVPVERREWSRTCRRCGFIEKMDHEPEEVRRERVIKENKAQIKKLRRELKKLEKK